MSYEPMRIALLLVLSSLVVGCGDRASPTDLGQVLDGVPDGVSPDGGAVVAHACVSPAFKGKLCGPADRPCAVLLDEIVPGQDTPRNDPPSLVIAPNDAPLVLFAVPVDGYHGYLGLRGADGTWSVSHLPMEVAQGSLACTNNGHVDLLVDDGAYGVTHWTGKGDDWTLVETLPAKHVSAHAFAQDHGGVFHASVKLGEHADTVAYARRNPTWKMRSLGESFHDAPLALSPGGEPYVASWQRTNDSSGDWKLVLSGATSDETITTSSHSSNDNQSFLIALAVVAEGTGEAPYLFFKKSADPSQSSDLAYARPGGAPGTWILGTIATDGSPAKCTHEPSYNGEKCSYDYLQHQPLAAVTTAGGELRLLFARRHFFGDLVAVCYDDSGAGGGGGAPADAGAGSADGYSPPTGCHWSGSENSESRLEMGWLSSTGVERVTLIDDKLLPWFTASARVDSLGRIHVAVYAYTTSSSIPMLRYMLIGSAP